MKLHLKNKKGGIAIVHGNLEISIRKNSAKYPANVWEVKIYCENDWEYNLSNETWFVFSAFYRDTRLTNIVSEINALVIKAREMTEKNISLEEYCNGS